MDVKDLKFEERAEFTLRSLYRRYGYRQYRMSKFEEYDLYVRNKSFLVSDNIITFNDTHGRTLALKPDVTLSIVKNARASEGLQKYCYNENVYRMSQTSGEFREIMQVGLECIGDISVYAMSETIMLAAESLRLISESYVLDVSHMGFLTAFLDEIGLFDEPRQTALRLISRKNMPELSKLGAQAGLDGDAARKLMRLAAMYGPIEDCLPQLREIASGGGTAAALDELESICSTVRNLGSWRINIDFSIVNDMNYYNGVIFRGFIDGIPSGVLSGGRYDNLMRRFDKDTGAIGFAVYLDTLELFDTSRDGSGVDVLLLCDADEKPEAVAKAVRGITDSGRSVSVSAGAPNGVDYRSAVRLVEGRLEPFEADD